MPHPVVLRLFLWASTICYQSIDLQETRYKLIVHCLAGVCTTAPALTEKATRY